MSYVDRPPASLGKRIGIALIVLLLIGFNVVALSLGTVPVDCPADLISECKNFNLWRWLIFPGTPLATVILVIFSVWWMSKSKD